MSAGRTGGSPARPCGSVRPVGLLTPQGDRNTRFRSRGCGDALRPGLVRGDPGSGGIPGAACGAPPHRWCQT